MENEVDARIEAIRAERTGEGVALTPRQARALAGEWYEWFIARHPVSDKNKWEALREQVHEALREAVGENEWERSDPDALWREDAKLRKALRPILADVGETAQFLAIRSDWPSTTKGGTAFLIGCTKIWQRRFGGFFGSLMAITAPTSTPSAFRSSMVLIPARHRSSYLRRGLLNGSQPAAALRVGVMSSPR